LRCSPRIGPSSRRNVGYARVVLIFGESSCCCRGQAPRPAYRQLGALDTRGGTMGATFGCETSSTRVTGRGPEWLLRWHPGRGNRLMMERRASCSSAHEGPHRGVSCDSPLFAELGGTGIEHMPGHWAVSVQPAGPARPPACECFSTPSPPRASLAPRPVVEAALKSPGRRRRRFGLNSGDRRRWLRGAAAIGGWWGAVELVARPRVGCRS
jgi:hypothetical protein